MGHRLLLAEEAEADQFYEDLAPSRANIKKGVLFIIEDQNAKVGSQEISRITS